MLEAVGNIFKIAELKKKILITLALIVVFEAGCFIPTPGINTHELFNFFERLSKNQGQTIFGVINMFTGGALQRLSIFALGVMPYISSSIIMQLLTAVLPVLERLAKEGKAGYEKINQYTRYLTFVLCIVQGYFLSVWLSNKANFQGAEIVYDKGIIFTLTTIFTLACGTVFIMWLGEQIQERGIGNGISIIIAVGIISRIPDSLRQLYVLYAPGHPELRAISEFKLAIMLLVWLAAVLGVILFSQAQRKIPVQYGKRVIGRRVMGGQSTFLPIRVDMAGVIAIIFAQSVILFPATLATFLPSKIRIVAFLQSFLQERGWGYNIVYVLLIFFFMYFYTAIVFNPAEISNQLKKHGGFIPGIRPGKPTSDFLDFVATRIVFVGALYVAIIAIMPNGVMAIFSVPSYALASFFGGTTIMIMVGVVLDTMKQIEGQLLIRHYEGFIKGSTLKARR